MYGNDVHEALYENNEIHYPWVRSSGPKVGSIWPYCKTVLNLRKNVYSHIHLLETKYTVIHHVYEHSST